MGYSFLFCFFLIRYLRALPGTYQALTEGDFLPRGSPGAHMVYSLSPVRLLVTPWTVPCQAPLSVGFPRQEHWIGLHFLLQGIFPTQGSNPRLQLWQVDS